MKIFEITKKRAYKNFGYGRYAYTRIRLKLFGFTILKWKKR